MKTWIEGQIRHSPTYGGEFKCLRRWFENDGCLEVVTLQRVDASGNLAGEPFERTARAMSAPLFPGVTEYRGGVTHPDRCPHETVITTVTYGRICRLCGGKFED